MARLMVVGAGESAGLFAVALVAGIVAAGFSAFIAFGGAHTRRLVDAARSH